MAIHTPVLLHEVLAGLEIQPQQWYLDATFGRGGHTQAILEKKGYVIAIDQDAEAIEYGTAHFQAAIQAKQLCLVKANFDSLSQAHQHAQQQLALEITIQGILFDFGASTDQLKSVSRGFSFDQEAPLDMRMDRDLQVTAKDLILALPARQLEELFREYGGETEARAIAQAIVRQREQDTHQLETTTQLADLIAKTKRHRKKHLHPATQVFQALRMAVNTELDAIHQALPQALNLLQPLGRLLTIAFHEGEDRIVKNVFKEWENQQLGTRVNKEVITPSQPELENNPRSRSAKLRIFKKS